MLYVATNAEFHVVSMRPLNVFFFQELNLQQFSSHLDTDLKPHYTAQQSEEVLFRGTLLMLVKKHTERKQNMTLVGTSGQVRIFKCKVFKEYLVKTYPFVDEDRGAQKAEEYSISGGTQV